MKDLKNNSFRLNKGTRVLITIFIWGIVAMGAFAFFWLGGRMRTSIEKQAQDALTSVSSQNVKIVDALLGSVQRSVNGISLELERTGQTDVDKILSALKSHEKTYGFYNMGVIEPDGTCYTTFGEKLNLSGYDYFLRSMQGESVMTEGYMEEEGTEMLNIFTEPVVIDGEVKLILTASYLTKDFLSMTDIPSFSDNGKSIVLDAYGRSVTRMNKKYLEDDSEGEMACFLTEHPEVIPTDTEENATFTYEYDGKRYVACCENLSMNRWKLLTYVPEDYLYQASRSINKNITFIIVGLYLTVMAVACLFTYVYRKFQERIMDIVFWDRITKHKNYQYYRLRFDEKQEKELENKYLVNFDIDKFKMINLIYGVRVGDQLLKAIFDLFRKTLPQDELYRYHADVFVAIMRGENRQEIIQKIRLFMDAVRREIDEGRLPECALTFGVSPMAGSSEIGMIYSDAVLAKNEVKGSITEKYKFYDDTLKVQVEYRNIELSFKEALRNREFHVWYQPKYDMRSGTICGAEALVRWKKTDGTVVFPGDFIPVFENTGQIIELDEEVLRIVCEDISRVRRRGGRIVPISVNLSKMHLMKAGIAEKIREITGVYGVTGEEISFEITESVSVNDKKMMDRLVDDIHRMGFKVDMDDYGTGSSTLWSLSDTSFDTLKLDKSFIDEIGSEKMNIIIKSTIKMASHLKMNIVAEGVEKEEQVKFLVENGCYTAQGYYYAKPVERSEFSAMLQEEEKKKRPERKDHR